MGSSKAFTEHWSMQENVTDISGETKKNKIRIYLPGAQNPDVPSLSIEVKRQIKLVQGFKEKKIKAPIGSQEESETEMCPRDPGKGLMLWNNMCRSVDNTRVT